MHFERLSPNIGAIWDDRSTQQFAVGDHCLQHRLMHRITVTSDIRVASRRAAAE